MAKSSKNQTLPLDRSLYQEISEIEASQYQGGAISNELITHELTHVVRQTDVVLSQTRIIIFAESSDSSVASAYGIRSIPTLM